MSTFIYPYKAGSNSAKDLAQALGIKRISHKNSKFKGNANKTIINWGGSELPEEVAKCNVLNKPESVALAANKLSFFNINNPTNGKSMLVIVDPDGHEITIHGNRPSFPVEEVGATCDEDHWTIKEVTKGGIVARIPDNTAMRGVARRWIQEGHKVLCRTILNGNSGAGIVIATTLEELVEAPLYVKYVPKKSEYRVHVFKGNTLAVQRKSRRKDVEDDKVNWLIRNHDNGFIFARGEDLGEVPEDVVLQAHNAVKSCGLDFGAVDVIYNEQRGLSYVLEVNTAPGLSGTTLEDYARAFTEVL